MRLTVSWGCKPQVKRLLNTQLVHRLAWRFKAFFSVFSVGPELISAPNLTATHRLRSIAGLTPIVILQTYIGISSGSPEAGNTPATVANYVYILAGGGGQSTSEGPLSGWLFASGCQ